MTRAINLLLIVAAVAALIFGGFWVGHAVWQTGNDNRNRALQETRTTDTRTVRTPSTAEPDRLSLPWVRAVLLVAGAIVVMSAVSPVIARLMRGGRRRDDWHA